MREILPKVNSCILLILDGFGIATRSQGNAVTLANTPNLDELVAEYPTTYLQASGEAVGLNTGDDGNSEVGHLTIGAGRRTTQLVERIENSIRSKNFFKNKALIGAVENTKIHNSNLHVVGLIGGGKVHSSFSHFVAMIELLEQQKMNGNKVFFHLITDGRDSAPQSAAGYFEKLELEIKKKNMGNIATLVGRHFAMDRDGNWDRTLQAYKLFTKMKGKNFSNWSDAIKRNYSKSLDDQYLEPSYISNFDEKFPGIAENDSVVFMNFRADRAIQLSKMFQAENIDAIKYEKIENLYFVGIADYTNELPTICAFKHEKISKTLGEIFSKHELRQLRIAESEKFKHVTYFFNGENDEAFAGEERIEIKSNSKVKSFDLAPKMRAKEITDILLEKLVSDTFSLIVVNFANADMVAHTGNIDATVQAIEFIDEQIGRIKKVAVEQNTVLIITSDHGNAEEMFTDGKIDTKHSTNPVPVIIMSEENKGKKISPGELGDIAPTILNMFGLNVPAGMTGRNLLD